MCKEVSGGSVLVADMTQGGEVKFCEMALRSFPVNLAVLKSL